MKLGPALRNLGVRTRRNMPSILTGLGICGGFTSIIFAVRATPKAMQKIKEAKAEKPVEKIKAAWTCYVPAAISFAASTACVIGANSIHLKRHAALGSAYAVLETTLAEYQKKVIETIGENQERKIREEIEEDRIRRIEEERPEEFDQVDEYDDEVYPIVEGSSGAVFLSNVNKVDKEANRINLRNRRENYISLAEVLWDLNIPKSKWKHDAERIERVGWNIDDGEIEIKKTFAALKDGRPTYIISYDPPPHYNFDRFG